VIFGWNLSPDFAIFCAKSEGHWGGWVSVFGGVDFGRCWVSGEISAGDDVEVDGDKSDEKRNL
jgi:hypothetical protein